jgi:hypothetical protein
MIRTEDDHAPTFGVLVPAWLHGLAWAGDPAASVPCAERQLESDEVLLFARSARFLSLGPLDLRHRAQRLIGRPVRQVPAPRSRSTTIAMPCPTPMHIVARP